MAKIFSINAGSSSLKFQLFEMPSEKVLTKGIVERIGLDESIFTIETNNETHTVNCAVPDHAYAVNYVLTELISKNIITNLTEINGVGHRVVHGGEHFSSSILITPEVIEKIASLNELSPLHNPANLVGIQAFLEKLPTVPNVAIFDTAFHQTMPEKAFLYSIPYSYYKNFGIRKYGFHGTSHQYVADRAAFHLKKPLAELKLITCHLGNGASIAAINAGKSVDTSMGFTPLEGLTMGTRSGNIDPAVIPYLMNKITASATDVINILNKQSGLLGISELSSDLRDIEAKANAGHRQAQLALEIFVDRIKKTIAMYTAVMEGVDAIIFTAGIGENSVYIRELVMTGFEYLGLSFDPPKNKQRGKECFITTDNSKVKAMVIPTNEELMIARDVISII